MEENRYKELNNALEDKFLPMFSLTSGMEREVLPDLYCYTNQIVNVIFVGDPAKTNEWVMIDTGMPGSANRLIEVAEKRFGKNGTPKAIIQTHGHFDHVGGLVDLVNKWDVKVYVHELEIPFLTGQQSYPEPDSSVEGGLIAKISPMFPNEPVDIGANVEALPTDGSIPHMPGWRWLHTPGHTPGHISLFRDQDSALVAGDSFVTVKQESLYNVITQNKELSGPPRYLTTDWKAARESVKKLEALKPAVAITGHGHPMAGKELSEGLKRLARDFDHAAIPDYGRFVDQRH